MPAPASLLSPEARLLLLATDDTPSPEGVREHLADPDLDFNRLVALAERERATAILWSAMLPVRDSIVPLRARQLAALASVSDFRMQHHESQLARVVGVLESIDIPVVLLKGAALAVSAYGSFRRRPMSDLDLLVREEDAGRAWDALRNEGWVHAEAESPADFYTEHYHLPPLDDPKGTGLSLELHTELWDGGGRLNSSQIWSASQVVAMAGRDYRVPSLTHQILHLATHFAWGHMLRSAAWRTIRDLRVLVDSGKVDWTEVVAAARVSGGAACCYWTFEIARCLAGVSIPESVMRDLRPPLPERAIRMLRRHYIGTLFEFSPAPCPSLRLDRLLWTAGHVTGQGDGVPERPWARSGEWLAGQGVTRPSGLIDRFRHHLNGIAGWVQYLRSVVAAQPKV